MDLRVRCVPAARQAALLLGDQPHRQTHRMRTAFEGRADAVATGTRGAPRQESQRQQRRAGRPPSPCACAARWRGRRGRGRRGGVAVQPVRHLEAVLDHLRRPAVQEAGDSFKAARTAGGSAKPAAASTSYVPGLRRVSGSASRCALVPSAQEGDLDRSP